MVVGLIPLFNQMVEYPEVGSSVLPPNDLHSFNGAKSEVKVPASFVRDWLTKGRRGFKSLVTGADLPFHLIEYLGHISSQNEMVNLAPFLGTIFGGNISVIAQKKISVFYVALINLPVKPPITVEVNYYL